MEGFNAKALRFLMKEKGIGAKKLAGLVGVTRQTIYEYLRGEKRPGLNHLLELCRHLGCAVDVLLPPEWESSKKSAE